MYRHYAVLVDDSCSWLIDFMAVDSWQTCQLLCCKINSLARLPTLRHSPRLRVDTNLHIQQCHMHVSDPIHCDKSTKKWFADEHFKQLNRVGLETSYVQLTVELGHAQAHHVAEYFILSTSNFLWVATFRFLLPVTLYVFRNVWLLNLQKLFLLITWHTGNSIIH